MSHWKRGGGGDINPDAFPGWCDLLNAVAPSPAVYVPHVREGGINKHFEYCIATDIVEVGSYARKRHKCWQIQYQLLVKC